MKTNSSKVKTVDSNNHHNNHNHKKKNGLMMTFLQGSSISIMNESPLILTLQCTSCNVIYLTCCGVAVTPVPIAHTGS